MTYPTPSDPAALSFSSLTAGKRPAPPATVTPVLQEQFVTTPENVEKLKAVLAEVDIDRPETFVLWGSGAQKKLGEVSTELMALTKTKDAGPVGASLNALVLNIRGFNVSDIVQATARTNRLTSLFRKAALPVAVAFQRYETCEAQVNRIESDLFKHIGKLTHDLVHLERIYAANVEAYEAVKLYIKAGDLVVEEIETNRLPALRAAVTEDDPLSSQRVARMNATKERLERRVADLVQTKAVTFQNLPTVGLIEDNDANLMMRIHSTIANAIPAWKQKIALLILQRNAMDAADAVRDANDMGNELMVETARMLNRTTTAIRTEVERGMFDAVAVKEANDQIIAAITTARTLYDEAAAKRRDARAVAEACETEMRRALEDVDGLGRTTDALSLSRN